MLKKVGKVGMQSADEILRKWENTHGQKERTKRTNRGAKLNRRRKEHLPTDGGHAMPKVGGRLVPK